MDYAIGGYFGSQWVGQCSCYMSHGLGLNSCSCPCHKPAPLPATFSMLCNCKDELAALKERIKLLDDRVTLIDKNCDDACAENAQKIAVLKKKYDNLDEQVKFILKTTMATMEKYPIGTAGQVLKNINGQYKWANPSTNLTFDEALAALRRGKRIRRPGWDNHYYYSLDSNKKICWGDSNINDKIGCRDFNANDWEIIE